MVPAGHKVVTATSARFPTQSVLDHSAKRVFERPDIKEYFEKQEDGARKQFVWKWGMDGQAGELVLIHHSSFSSSGMAAYAKSKDHDDRQCINEGIGLMIVGLPSFVICTHLYSLQTVYAFLLQGRDEADKQD